MATIWSIASTKGGCGKTTLTAIIASEIVRSGGTVVLLDTDENRPLVRWAKLGKLPDEVNVIDATDKSGRTLTEVIERLRQTRHFVLIDTEGTQNMLTGLAIQKSSVVVVPMKWSELDMAEAQKIQAFVKVASDSIGRTIPSVIVPSQVDAAIESKAQRDLKDQFAETGATWIDPPVLNKSPFVAMFTQGCLLQDLPETGKSTVLQNAKENAHAVVKAIGRAAVQFTKVN
jgi:chromosome partitioning protein